MPTHIQRDLRPVPTVDVAGARWPINKLAAVCAGLVMATSALLFGGSAIAAAWTAAVVVLAVWWGGYAWYGRRWEHGPREYAAAYRREEH
ncbi:hypothetical protein L5I01_21155 [Gordonia sp. HY442]|uniref:hypothetical protein n=1 Tax=Gordonia zhenghanii TaxID=2911516 RepID=UPI001F40C74B|nr:hypothetical protein [Gordonia zhenghanii]MCF8605868.1 hypothetical protein [Gordonia zhenghanii]